MSLNYCRTYLINLVSGSRLEDNDARRMSEIATLEASHNDRMNDLHRC